MLLLLDGKAFVSFSEQKIIITQRHAELISNANKIFFIPCLIYSHDN